MVQETQPEQMPFSEAEWAQTPPAVQEFVLELIVRVQRLETELSSLRERVNRNLGERQVRHTVLWRKTCFGTRSKAGSRFAERITMVVAALKQQQRNVLDYLTNACDAANWGRPAPSLLPTAPTS